jgi:hypothetical protein
MVATRGKRVGVEVEIAKTHEKWDAQASANTVPRTTVTTYNGTGSLSHMDAIKLIKGSKIRNFHQPMEGGDLSRYECAECAETLRNFRQTRGLYLSRFNERKSSDNANFVLLTRSVSQFGNATPRQRRATPLSLNFDRDLVNFTPFYF